MEDFELWHMLMAGEKPAVIPQEPQVGFWRARRGGELLPFLVFRDADKVKRVTIGKEYLNGELAEKAWLYAVKNPIAYEWLHIYAKTGRWPDEGPTIGHNKPPVEFNEWEDVVGQLCAQAAKVTVTNDVELNAAQAMRAELNRLKGDLEKTRKEKTDPLYKVYKAEMDKWSPLEKRLTSQATKVRETMEAYARAKDEALKAAGQPIPEPTPVKGATGRAAATIPRPVVVVEDQDALYQHFKSHPYLIEALKYLALTQYNERGSTAPGIKIEFERSFR